MIAAADQGLPAALEKLHEMLRSGAVEDQSVADSTPTVEDKLREAFFLLGSYYLEGTRGFEQNLKAAEKFLRKASNLSHPEADLCLGRLMLEWRRNDEAFQFIRRAAEVTGSAVAQRQLGKTRNLIF